MTTLIALCGPAGSGKTTVANHLVEKYGAQRYSLAAPLKDIAKRVFEFTDDQLYGTQASKEAVDPRYGFSPRWLLQRLGTEGIRGVFGDDVWVDHMLKTISEENPYLAVCDDCRFQNEARLIRSSSWDQGGNYGYERGLVWRLLNPNRQSSAGAAHASEAEWSKAPYDQIIEAGNVELLLHGVDALCARFAIGRV